MKLQPQISVTEIRTMNESADKRGMRSVPETGISGMARKLLDTCGMLIAGPVETSRWAVEVPFPATFIQPRAYCSSEEFDQKAQNLSAFYSDLRFSETFASNFRL